MDNLLKPHFVFSEGLWHVYVDRNIYECGGYGLTMQSAYFAYISHIYHALSHQIVNYNLYRGPK